MGAGSILVRGGDGLLDRRWPGQGCPGPAQHAIPSVQFTAGDSVCVVDLT